MFAGMLHDMYVYYVWDDVSLFACRRHNPNGQEYIEIIMYQRFRVNKVTERVWTRTNTIIGNQDTLYKCICYTDTIRIKSFLWSNKL